LSPKRTSTTHGTINLVSRGWTVTASAVVRGDFDAVVAWWMDERRWAEWRAGMEFCTGRPIAWTETGNGLDKIIEGRWVTTRGAAASCVVVVHPAEHDAGATVVRKSVTTPVAASGRRSERSSVASIQTVLRRDQQKTRVRYEHAYKTIGTCAVCQRVQRLRLARTSRSELRSLAQRCEADLGVPRRQWA